MPNVFAIYETDPYQEELIKLLSEIGLNVFHSNFANLKKDGHELYEADLFLVDMTRFSPGTKYIEDIQEKYPYKPIILTHMREQVSLEDLLGYKNVIDFISQPISIPDLGSRILNAWTGFVSELGTRTQGITGFLQDQNLLNLLQTFKGFRRSGQIHLQEGSKQGTVIFKKGKLVSARYKDFEPKIALRKMIFWLSGSYKMEFNEVESDDHFNEKFEEIIKNGMERLSGYLSRKEQLPDGVLFSITQYNPEEFNQVELDILQFFIPGRSVNNFLARENVDDFELVKILSEMINRGVLYTSKEMRDEADDKNKGIGKLISRMNIFSKEEKQVAIVEKIIPKEADKENITEKKQYIRRFALAQLNEMKDIIRAVKKVI